MNKEILFVLLDEFAEWESAFIAALLNFGTAPGRARYTVKTLSVTRNPVVSIGGFHVLPDYDLQSVPADYAGLSIGMRNRKDGLFYGKRPGCRGRFVGSRLLTVAERRIDFVLLRPDGSGS